MKKWIVSALFCCLTTLLGAQPKYEVRAVWLTTIGGIDWPATYAHDGMGVSQQQRQLTDMLDRLQAAHVNTVLLQTRIRATTIYPSQVEPWDGCLSGQPGKSPGYDALQFAIDECHRRGMELHAWVVTIPVGKWNSYGCRRLQQQYGRLIRKIGDEGYMNPESPITADYIAGICEEITRHYDIDGIHLDYIRYPETWRGSKQKEHITRIVKTIHQRVKALKPWVKLSCSPLGKYDNLTRYHSRGWNALRTVAQDAQQWMRDGLMDQLYPMMYFAGNGFYPFAIDWQEQAAGRTVVSGLAVYMLDPAEGKWKLPELQRQLSVTRQIGLGHCYFRAKFLLDNQKGIYDFAQYFDRQPALVPPMTWAGRQPPAPPRQVIVRPTADGDSLAWSGARDRSGGPYLLYNVYASHRQPVDISNPANLVAARLTQTKLLVPPPATTAALQAPLYYAVTAVDRYGSESTTAAQGRHLRQHHSAMLSNDGLHLQLPATDTDHQFLAVCSLQGNIVSTCRRQPVVDISRLPDGIYQLKSLGKKGASHRLGFFTIRR